MAPGIDTGHNGTTFEIVSQILMELDEFFVRLDNIWQTLVCALLLMLSQFQSSFIDPQMLPQEFH